MVIWNKSQHHPRRKQRRGPHQRLGLRRPEDRSGEGNPEGERNGVPGDQDKVPFHCEFGPARKGEPLARATQRDGNDVQLGCFDAVIQYPAARAAAAPTAINQAMGLDSLINTSRLRPAAVARLRPLTGLAAARCLSSCDATLRSAETSPASRPTAHEARHFGLNWLHTVLGDELPVKRHGRKSSTLDRPRCRDTSLIGSIGKHHKANFDRGTNCTGVASARDVPRARPGRN